MGLLWITAENRALGQNGMLRLKGAQGSVPFLGYLLRLWHVLETSMDRFIGSKPENGYHLYSLSGLQHSLYAPTIYTRYVAVEPGGGRLILRETGIVLATRWSMSEIPRSEITFT